MEVVVSKICIDNHIGGGVVRSFCLLSVYRGNGCGSGVADAGDPEVIRLFLISRIPRLLAILCTGIGMSTAGLIMQQLCMNKFVSPTTGQRFLPPSLEFCWRWYFFRSLRFLEEQCLHLWRQSWEPGFLCGLSRKSVLKMWCWCRWSELCLEM